MTGLETILSQIQDDAQREAEEQLSAAKSEAAKILEAAKAEAQQKSQAVLQEGEQKAQAIRDRAQSAAQLERRNAMLAFKQQVIREAIHGIRASLEAAPDQEYFQLLLQLAARFAREGKAEMRLNQRDLDRLPKNFEDDLRRAVPQAEIAVSKEPCNIESGFLLAYGGIDINCTFRAIFEDAEGELRDVAGKLLFCGSEKGK